MMRKALAVLLIAAAAWQTAHAKEIAVGGPRIQVDKPDHDFGTIPQQAVLEHVLKICNTGDETLKITKVRSSCGCTVANADKEIAPGECGEVKVTFKSQNFTKTVHKNVTLQTNDPENKTVKLTITANVLADIVCTPLIVDFKRFNRGDKPESTVRISSPRGKKFSIVDAKPSKDYIQAKVIEPEEGKDDYVVKIGIVGIPPTGAFRGSVTISTDLDKKRSLTVTVRGYVRSRTDIIPRKLFFGIVGDGQTPKRDILIRANSWDGLKVEKVEAPDMLNVTTEEITEGKEWRVSVQLNGPFESKMFRERIRIYINDPQMRKIELKVQAILRKKK